MPGAGGASGATEHKVGRRAGGNAREDAQPRLAGQCTFPEQGLLCGAGAAGGGGQQVATSRGESGGRATRLQLVRLVLQSGGAGVDKPPLGVEQPDLVRQLCFQRQQAALGGGMRGAQKSKTRTRRVRSATRPGCFDSPERLPSARWHGGPPHPPPAPGPPPRQRRCCRRPTVLRAQPHAAAPTRRAWTQTRVPPSAGARPRLAGACCGRAGAGRVRSWLEQLLAHAPRRAAGRSCGERRQPGAPVSPVLQELCCGVVSHSLVEDECPVRVALHPSLAQQLLILLEPQRLHPHGLGCTGPRDCWQLPRGAFRTVRVFSFSTRDSEPPPPRVIPSGARLVAEGSVHESQRSRAEGGP